MAQLDVILPSLYRISSVREGGNFSFCQFLIKDEKSILIHTGSALEFPGLAERLGQVISLSDLVYVFISHFEADECGALTSLLLLNRNIIPLASEAAARQLSGFGLYSQTQVVKPGEELSLGHRKLKFIAYPSEVHLREGLMAYETTDKVLFSSDLFVSRGTETAPIVKSSPAVLKEIPLTSIPSEEGRRKCLEAVGQLNIALVATGHGPVLDLRA